MQRRITFLLAMLLLFSCRKEPTSWLSDWELPILKDTIFIADFINDSTIGVNPDGTLHLQLERDLLNLDIFSLVQLPDTTIDQEFSVSLSQINIPPGTNYIDEVKEHAFGLSGAALTKTYLKEGIAEITISNPIATKTIFQVQLPGVSKNGIPFSRTEEVPAASNGNAGTRTFIIDLAEHDVDLSGENGNSYNKLQSRMSVTTDPSGPSIIVTNQDIARFNVTFKGLKPSYAKGFFGAINISDTATIDLGPLNNVSADLFQLNNVNLDLTLVNGVKVAGRGTIHFVNGENNAGNNTSLTHPIFNESFLINPATGAWDFLQPFKKIIAFNAQNSNIQSFLENLPSRLNLAYNIELNPWGNTSNGTDELFPNSRLGLRLKTDFPLQLGTENLRYIDTFSISFEAQKNTFRIHSGGIVLNTINSFPFTANAALHFLDEWNVPRFTVVSDESITAGQYDIQTNAHSLESNELYFGLSKEQIEELPDIKKIIVSILVNSNSINDNPLRENDQLQISLKTKFKLNTVIE